MKNPKPDLTKLAVESQNGDKNAYQMLLENLYRISLKYLHKKIYNKESIEDLAQEILLSIHKALPTYNPNQKFSSWFFAIMNYKIINFYRKEVRHRSIVTGSEPLDYLIFHEKFFDDRDVKKLLDNALGKLPKFEQELITVLKLGSYTIKEAAEHFQKNEGAIRTAAHRAYKKLKVLLINEGYET